MKIFPGQRRWAVDAMIAIAVTAVSLAWAHYSGRWHQAGREQLGALWYLPVLLGGMALIARRAFPVPVLAVTLIMALWGVALNAWTAWLALNVAFITAVLARRRAAAIGSMVVGYLVSIWPPWLLGSSGGKSVTAGLGLLAWLLGLLAAAELVRARAELVGRRAEEARRRVSEQRLAIARDLHDVVAHNISVINVQANTALHLMQRQPERAEQALTAIHQVSKQALGELRSLLGVLRDPDSSASAFQAPLAPEPGLDRLRELAAGTAGIAVRLVTDGTPRPVPAEVDLAGYRIVQEALTNSVRHSGGSTVTVRLQYEEEAVTISVDDDGTAPSRPPRPGNGLAGMAERARALGGALEAGPRPGGGFRVLARLPA